MGAIRIANFGGEIPRMDRRALPDTNAQICRGSQLADGALTPQKTPLRVELVGPSRSVFRLYDSGGDYWLRFSQDVDVCRGPIAGDTSFRVLYSSAEFEPRQTNLALAKSASPFPGACFVLGVTPPAAKPTYSVFGGSGTNESRAYVYTLVTQWGEESSPSPAGDIVTGFANGTWNLDLPSGPPPNTGAITGVTTTATTVTVETDSVYGLRVGERIAFAGVLGMTDLNAEFAIQAIDTAAKKITVALATEQTYVVGGAWARKAPHNTTGMKKRIYRSITTGTSAEYFFIGEVDVTTATFADNVTIIGEPCPTVGWAMPPVGMQGIGILPSGAAYGFVDNEVCFSEPGAVYAWPVQYRMTCASPVVAVKDFGQSLVVGTKGSPEIISGIDPAVMTKYKFPVAWPCASKRSMVSVLDGVVYASPFGLVLVDNAGPRMAADAWFDSSAWRRRVDSNNLLAVEYNGKYVSRVGETLMFFGEGKLVFFSMPEVTALYTDQANGKLYVVSDGELVEWAAGSARYALDWKSKEIVSPRPLSLGAAKVDADFTATPEETAALAAARQAVIDENLALIATGDIKGGMGMLPMGKAVLNGSLLKAPPPASYDQLALILYVNNDAVYSVPITDSRAVRLPAIGKYDNFALRITGNVKVWAVLVADTKDGLKDA
jgi:hypothetical protein